jgi:hypothetical protein
MTPERWDDLKEVNQLVNAAIVPEHNYGGLATEHRQPAPIRRTQRNSYASENRWLELYGIHDKAWKQCWPKPPRTAAASLAFLNQNGVSLNSCADGLGFGPDMG